MADYGVQLGKLFFVGAMSVVLTIDFVVGLQTLYYWQLNQAEASDGLYQRPAALQTLVESQQARLAEYRVVDAKKGIVAIPIGRAMELVVTELSHRGDATPPNKGETR